MRLHRKNTNADVTARRRESEVIMRYYIAHCLDGIAVEVTAEQYGAYRKNPMYYTFTKER